MIKSSTVKPLKLKLGSYYLILNINLLNHNVLFFPLSLIKYILLVTCSTMVIYHKTWAPMQQQTPSQGCLRAYPKQCQLSLMSPNWMISNRTSDNTHCQLPLSVSAFLWLLFTFLCPTFIICCCSNCDSILAAIESVDATARCPLLNSSVLFFPFTHTNMKKKTQSNIYVYHLLHNADTFHCFINF